MNPLVSIISINYKQARATQAFLRSCKQLSYPNLEIILVDNAPDLVFHAELSKEFPAVQIIASEKNLGFAGGNNLGIQAAKGEYLLFLNNDTLVDKNLVQSLLNGFHLSDHVGVVCPKILYLKPPNTLQFAGYTAINPYTGRNKTLGNGEPDQGQYETPKQTPYAHGAAMMVKETVISAVGPMPELFFLYYEELDWSEKIRQSGFEIWYIPSGIIHHHASLSTGSDSPLKTYYYFRNRILFMRRNTSSFSLAVFFLYFYLLLTPAKLLIFLVKGRIKHAIAFLRAITWHISHP